MLARPAALRRAGACHRLPTDGGAGVLVAGCTVVIETRTAGGAPALTERFEVTPAPEPGTEREVLRQLVTGIHPGAVELGHSRGRSRFGDGGRRITARFEPAGAAEDGTAGPERVEPPPSGAQGTLFDP